MPMHPQSRTLMFRAALWRTVTILALFSFFLVSANVTIQAMPEHFTAQSTLTTSSLDCTASELGSSLAHCQSANFAIAVGSRFSVPFLPILGSSVWCYAAGTCAPPPINQRLLRPPKLLRAYV